MKNCELPCSATQWFATVVSLSSVHFLVASILNIKKMLFMCLVSVCIHQCQREMDDGASTRA